MKGSGTFCAVANCRNCRKRALEMDRTVSFHRFPKNPELRKTWISRCRRPWEFKADTSFICSDHFEEGDFLRDLKAELLGLKATRRLKEGATPTLNLPPEVVEVEVPESGEVVTFDLLEQQREQEALVFDQELLTEIDPFKVDISDLDDYLILEELVDETAFDDPGDIIILDLDILPQT